MKEIYDIGKLERDWMILILSVFLLASFFIIAFTLFYQTFALINKQSNHSTNISKNRSK